MTEKIIKDLILQAPAGQEIFDQGMSIIIMLLEKNISYGNSALSPLSIFSNNNAGEQLDVRIDDKLNRIKNNKSFVGDNDLDDLIGYFTKIKNKEIVPEKFFTDVVEMEFRLTELFQLKVLGMDFMNEIVPNRYKFSFKNYLETGNGFSDPNYKGTTLLYDDKLSNVILQPSIIR